MAQGLAYDAPSAAQLRRDLLAHVQPQPELYYGEVVAREGA